MRARRTGRTILVMLIIISIALICGSIVAVYHFNGEVGIYQRSSSETNAFFQSYTPHPFINTAVDAEPYQYENPHDEALYTYEAPEGFTIISHSPAWDQNMLELLYHELMLNEHGDEINFLYEVVVYPDEEEETSILASYSLGTTFVSFFTLFPAFPDDFTVNFPKDIGSINLYGGNTKTTIESIAESLSHEYGHLYTFYYMFDSAISEGESLSGTSYARFREADRFDLITSSSPGSTYMQERFRYLIEIAAEDYVQLMGSPTTRQVVDFVDVQQLLNGAELPTSIRGARNAFPQENMMIPLAGDVQGLKEYFYSYIGKAPRVPREEKQEITLEISRSSVQHDLTSGRRTFVYYTIIWNAPYQNAIYTLAWYDPDNYAGWGNPVKTVHPGQSPSAVIGEYVVERGDRIHFPEDGRVFGTRVFYVVAMLPDGTFYISDKLEYNFD